ncbi:hypothetical protein MMC16_003715 [Acarospora aff. strigata]|nr:hypothetical protein [Acarospora aff. strigata]
MLMGSVSESVPPVVLKLVATDEKCDSAHPKAVFLRDARSGTWNHYVCEATQVPDVPVDPHGIPVLASSSGSTGGSHTGSALLNTTTTLNSESSFTPALASAQGSVSPCLGSQITYEKYKDASLLFDYVSGTTQVYDSHNAPFGMTAAYDSEFSPPAAPIFEQDSVSPHLDSEMSFGAYQDPGLLFDFSSASDERYGPWT